MKARRTLRGRVVAARRRLDAQREDLQVRDRREARRREGLAERVRRVAGDVGVGAAVACAVRVSPRAIDATSSPCVDFHAGGRAAVARLRDVPGHEPRAARQVRLDQKPPQEGHAVLAGRLGPELLALADERRLRRAAAVRDPQIGPGLVDAAEERARYFRDGHGVRRRRATQVRLAACRVHARPRRGPRRSAAGSR